MNISANIMPAVPSMLPANRAAGDSLGVSMNAEKPAAERFEFASLVEREVDPESKPPQENEGAPLENFDESRESELAQPPQDNSMPDPEAISDQLIDTEDKVPQTPGLEEIPVQQATGEPELDIPDTHLSSIDESPEKTEESLETGGTSLDPEVGQPEDVETDPEDAPNTTTSKQNIEGVDLSFQDTPGMFAVQPETTQSGKNAREETANLALNLAQAAKPAPQDPVGPLKVGQLAAQTISAVSNLAGLQVNGSNPKPVLHTDSPTMFRSQAKVSTTAAEIARDTTTVSPNTFGKSNVLELFANRVTANNGSNTSGGAQSFVGQQPGGTSASSNAVAAKTISMLGNSGNVSVQNTTLNPAGQVPIMPLSTVYGLSNHVMMQAHPAITDRQSPVEASFIPHTPVRASKTLELQLVPRTLGVVELKIQNQNGVVKIAIETQSVEAQRLIRSETSNMLETFKNAGLKVEELQVTQNSRLEANSQAERDNRQDSSAFDQNKNNSNQQQLSNRNSDQNPEFQFDHEALGMVEATSEVTPAEAQLAREGLYL